DVTLIDNALQLAANLRVNAALPEDCPSGTSTDEVSLPPASVKTPAGSLLARGSAMDLQYIQDGLTPQDGRDSSMTTRASRYHYKPSPKRRRLDTADSLVRQREHESDIQDWAYQPTPAQASRRFQHLKVQALCKEGSAIVLLDTVLRLSQVLTSALRRYQRFTLRRDPIQIVGAFHTHAKLRLRLPSSMATHQRTSPGYLHLEDKWSVRTDRDLRLKS
ncbi:MAG: hypothetical protein Q9180_007691, partial [Flavoplaca navasiana]